MLQNDISWSTFDPEDQSYEDELEETLDDGNVQTFQSSPGNLEEYQERNYSQFDYSDF
jgi:hypothetical protein